MKCKSRKAVSKALREKSAEEGLIELKWLSSKVNNLVRALKGIEGK